MAAERPPSPGGALLLVALVWTLVLGVREVGAERADAALLALVSCLCALLLPARPAPRPPRPGLRALAAAAVAGFAGAWLMGAAAGAVAPLLGLPPPALRVPGPWLAACQLGPGPLLEELLYRERLFCALRPALGRAGAVAASSALFAAAHPDPWAGAAALGVGVALGAAFAATGSLAPCVAAHVGVNLAAWRWACA